MESGWLFGQKVLYKKSRSEKNGINVLGLSFVFSSSGVILRPLMFLYEYGDNLKQILRQGGKLSSFVILSSAYPSNKPNSIILWQSSRLWAI
jgi:hypothetical protein